MEKDPKKFQKWGKERLRSRDVEREVGTVRKKWGGVRKSTAESNRGKEKKGEREVRKSRERRKGRRGKEKKTERKERDRENAGTALETN